MIETRAHSRRRFWWVAIVLLPLAVVLHGRIPDYAVPDAAKQMEVEGQTESADWSGVTRVGRLIARVPHARIVFPTALILAVWLLTIVIAYGRDVYFQNRDKRAESRLFSELVNSSRIGYCSAAENLRIESCNVALAEMLGIGRNELIGRPLAELGLDPERLAGGNVTALTIGLPGSSRIPVLVAAMDGDDVVGLQIIAAPFPGSDASAAGTARTKETDNLKREFLRNLNHELRTPLTVILGSATILESDVSEGNVDLVDAIKEGGERLLHVLEAMMLLSELEAESPDEATGSVEMGAVVREAAAEYGGLAKEKGLEFRVEVPDDLLFASAEPRGVRQILSQLIDNAVKFTDSGAIDLAVSREGPRIRLSVADTGRGMDPAVLAIAAADFREGPQSGRAASGIGLGLARLIAERMRGRLEVASTPGAGTRVDVYLRDASALEGASEHGSIAA